MNSPPADSTANHSNLPRVERLEGAAVAVVIVLAVGLRLWGIGFGFPERVRPDEQYFVNAVQRFDRYNTLDPDWYLYPSLYMYANLAVWRAYTLVALFRGQYEVADSRQRQLPTHGLDQVRARSPDREFLLGRLVTAFFGVATVIVLYRLGRRSYGCKAAVAAAYLLAINGLHTLNSHFYKSDVATTFFTVCALSCMIRFVEEKRVGWNIGAAIATGLATSTNYYGGFLLLPLLVSQFLAQAGHRTGTEGAAVQRQGRRRPEPLASDDACATNNEIVKLGPSGVIGQVCAALRAAGCTLADWQTYAMPAIAAAAFVATSPYCFIHWADFLNGFHRMVFADRQSLYETMVKRVQFDDFGFQGFPGEYSLRFCYRYSMGLILGLAAAVGLVFLPARRKAAGALLLLFFLIHFFMTASGKAVFMRYYLSLAPILTLAAGVLISRAVERIAPGRPRRQAALVAAALAVCGAEGLWTSVQQDRLLMREDTRVEARRWLAQNLSQAALVGTPVDWWAEFYPYGKPTLPAPSRYVPVRPDQVREKNLRFLLVDDSPLRLYSPPDRSQWTAWLAQNAEMVFEVSPYGAGSGEIRAVYDQLDAFYVPVARFRGVERPGPRIRVYAVKPAR